MFICCESHLSQQAVARRGAPARSCATSAAWNTRSAAARGPPCRTKCSWPSSRCRRARRSRSRCEASARSTKYTAGPTQCRAATLPSPLGAPSPQGVGMLDPLSAIPMQDTATAHAGDPLFVRVRSRPQSRRRRRRDGGHPPDGARHERHRSPASVRDRPEHRRVRLRRDRLERRDSSSRCRSSTNSARSMRRTSIRWTRRTPRRPTRWSIRSVSCSIRRPACR